jgi:putative sterol carrier protein
MAKQRATTETNATTKRIGALSGVTGRVRFETGAGVRAFSVQNGALQPEDPSTPTDAVITVDGETLFDEVFTGKKNPIVMALQGRLRVEGNLELGTRVLLGLQSEGSGDKPVTAEVRS